MVHNGIEYAIMQLISEAYDLLHRGLGLTNDELHTVFDNWNKGDMRSFLIEITADIFLQPDDKTPNRLVDMILDTAAQKGTGKWMSQHALDLGVPTTLITEAVYARCLSAQKDARVRASKVLSGPAIETFTGGRVNGGAADRGAMGAQAWRTALPAARARRVRRRGEGMQVMTALCIIPPARRGALQRTRSATLDAVPSSKGAL